MIPNPAARAVWGVHRDEHRGFTGQTQKSRGKLAGVDKPYFVLVLFLTRPINLFYTRGSSSPRQDRFPRSTYFAEFVMISVTRGLDCRPNMLVSMVDLESPEFRFVE